MAKRPPICCPKCAAPCLDDSLTLGKLNKRFKETLFPSDADVEQRNGGKRAGWCKSWSICWICCATACPIR